MAPSLSLLVLKTGHLNRLKSFYEYIGCEFVQEQHGSGLVHYSTQVGACLLELYPLSGEISAETEAVRLGFQVEKLDAIITQFREQSLLIAQAPKKSAWGYRAVVIDPDGRKVELVERQDENV